MQINCAVDALCTLWVVCIYQDVRLCMKKKTTETFPNMAGIFFVPFSLWNHLHWTLLKKIDKWGPLSFRFVIIFFSLTLSKGIREYLDLEKKIFFYCVKFINYFAAFIFNLSLAVYRSEGKDMEAPATFLGVSEVTVLRMYKRITFSCISQKCWKGDSS